MRTLASRDHVGRVLAPSGIDGISGSVDGAPNHWYPARARRCPSAPSAGIRSAAPPTTTLLTRTGRTGRAAPGTGYIDIRTTLPYSGNLRLAYTYPEAALLKPTPLLPPDVPGTTIVSRTVKVTVTS